jgi:hypothetical protein
MGFACIVFAGRRGDFYAHGCDGVHAFSAFLYGVYYNGEAGGQTSAKRRISCRQLG